MEAKDIVIGSEFVRPNGTIVRVTNERIFCNARELELTPISVKGRISWKLDCAVLFDLKPHKDGEGASMEPDHCKIITSSDVIEELQAQLAQAEESVAQLLFAAKALIDCDFDITTSAGERAAFELRHAVVKVEGKVKENGN